MGKTPSFNPYYGKNAKDEKIKLGISFGGKHYPGISHPSEAKAKVKATIQSTKPTTKKFSFKKPSRR
jgi:hypothetical protein